MGACVAATLYLYFNSKYRRWKDLDQLAKSMQRLPGVPIQVSFSNIQKATNNFHETMKLGQGGFGAVYRCGLPAPVKGEVLEVAVKKFTRDDNRCYEDLRHKNIVPLVGKPMLPVKLSKVTYMFRKSFNTCCCYIVIIGNFFE
jgi:interleukin-1 receptor-associated kinase 1